MFDYSAFHPSGVGKSLAGVKAGCACLCRAASTLVTPRSSEIACHEELTWL